MLYGDFHPAIIPFNGNLIDVYASSESGEKKQKSMQIAEKNAEIADKYYGENSIYCLKAQFDIVSSKINQDKMEEAQKSIAAMRKIVQRFHDDDPRDLMNQHFFMSQIISAIALMSPQY